jgi:hypothetical protein
VETDELEKMSSRELHDRALQVARHRFDVGFLWSVVKAIPIAHSAEGRVDEAGADIASVTRLLNDLVHSGEGDVADGLRPLYIDYLSRHA